MRQCRRSRQRWRRPAGGIGPDSAASSSWRSLHNAGVLSDEEFAAAKAKLLGG